MKERQITFSTEMVRAILEGRKTMTRRGVAALALMPDDLGGMVAKCPYGVPGDRLTVYCRYAITKWRSAEGNPDIPERRLHGGVGRADIQPNEVCGLWRETSGGLVPIEQQGAEREGVCVGEPLSQQCESEQERAPAGMHGIPRDAADNNGAGEALGRGPEQQHPEQPIMGDPDRELAGSENSRETLDQPYIQVHAGGARTHQVGGREGLMLATSSRTHLGRYPIFNPSNLQPLTLEIVSVRVERVQDISEEDAQAEGVTCTYSTAQLEDKGDGPRFWTRPRKEFEKLWDHIYRKEPEKQWDANPYVWVIEFKVVS